MSIRRNGVGISQAPPERRTTRQIRVRKVGTERKEETGEIRTDLHYCERFEAVSQHPFRDATYG
jgi:hypothetical protein